MSVSSLRQLAYLTADIPGCGGVIKSSAADFIVSEIPAYEPCGSGEHLYVTIEKQGLTTLEAIQRIARTFGKPEREIGYAGMKDSVGITRQALSIQGGKPEEFLGRCFDGIKVLSAVRHTNKLKLGHLKGNRFRIVVRDISKMASETVPAVLEVLKQRGVPNYFGLQRYGGQGNSHLIGAAMLAGEWDEAVETLIGDPAAVRDESWQKAICAFREGDLASALNLMPRHCRTERELLQRLMSRPGDCQRAFQVVHPRLKKLYLSAFQSYLFDQVVQLRLDKIDQLMKGDLAWKHVNGACFVVEDPLVEAERAKSFEISASGPMFGSKMKHPDGEPLELEKCILQAARVESLQFKLENGLRLEGERRPLRVPLDGVESALEGDHLVLEFALPKGSYATSVVREITKNF